MAKNTYRDEALHTARKNEVRGKNEPRKANLPKGEKQKKPKRSWNLKMPKMPSFRIGFLHDRRFKLAIGFTFLLLSFFLTIAFVSYLFTGNADQSVVESVSGTGLKQSGQEAENWLGLVGAWVSHLFIYDWVGVGAFFFIPVLFFAGLGIVFKRVSISLTYIIGLCSFSMLWTSLTLGYIVFATATVDRLGFLGGGIGVETAIWLDSLIGWGSWLLLGFLLLVFLVGFFNITSVNWGFKTTAADEDADDEASVNKYADSLGDVMGTTARGINHNVDPTASLESDEEEEDEYFDEDDDEINRALEMELNSIPPKNETPPAKPAAPILELDIETNDEIELEDSFEDELEEEMELEIAEVPEEAEAVAGENYDPTLYLARYQYPHIDLLTDYCANKIQVSK